MEGTLFHCSGVKRGKCGALRDLVPFIQFKKHEKHPWKGVTFSENADQKPGTLLKVTLLHGCFSRFLNLQMITNRAKRLI